MQNEKKQQKIFAVGFSLVVIIILFFLLKPFVLDRKSNQKEQNDQKANAEILKAPSVMPEDLLGKIQAKSKIFLIDVSSQEDFERGHIEKAVNVSMEGLNSDFLKSIGAEKTADIFVMNQGDNLAGLAASVNKIIASEFVNAKYLRGGISGWREEGYPLVSSGGSEADGVKVKKITIDEIRKDVETNPEFIQFLDVREKDSFAREHIFRAINIPFPELETKKGEIPALKKIIVYGENEKEAFQAAVALFDLNFFNVWQLEGGIEEWKAAGGNVESADGGQ